MQFLKNLTVLHNVKSISDIDHGLPHVLASFRSCISFDARYYVMSWHVSMQHLTCYLKTNKQTDKTHNPLLLLIIGVNVIVVQQ